MTLLQIIQDAESKVDTYKHPDLDDFRAQINPVLAALGRGTLGYDSVSQIDVGDSYVRIKTEYTVRGCDCSNDYEIPMEVIKAKDPVHAAKRLLLTKKISEAENAKAAAQHTIERATATLSTLHLELVHLDRSAIVLPSPDELRQKLQSLFPVDASGWNQACGAVLDLCSYARNYAGYGEEHALPFASFTSPAEYNTKGIDGIVSFYEKMDQATRTNYVSNYRHLWERADEEASEADLSA